MRFKAFPFRILMVLFLLLPAVIAPQQSTAAESGVSPLGSPQELLQFSSGGHMLGFYARDRVHCQREPRPAVELPWGRCGRAGGGKCTRR